MVKQSDKQTEQGMTTDNTSVSTQNTKQNRPKCTHKKTNPATAVLDVQADNDIDNNQAVSDTQNQSSTTKTKSSAKPLSPKSKPKNTDAQSDGSRRTNKKQTHAGVNDTFNHNKASTQQVSETMLEFIETENGSLVLQEVGTDEILVSIAFSDKVKQMVGAEHIHSIGQSMISAAIATVMERQMRQYHAHVYDETPKRFS